MKKRNLILLVVVGLSLTAAQHADLAKAYKASKFGVVKYDKSWQTSVCEQFAEGESGLVIIHATQVPGRPLLAHLSPKKTVMITAPSITSNQTAAFTRALPKGHVLQASSGNGWLKNLPTIGA